MAPTAMLMWTARCPYCIMAPTAAMLVARLMAWLVVVALLLSRADAAIACTDHRGPAGTVRRLVPLSADGERNLILHGAGQDDAAFLNYTTYALGGDRSVFPALFMAYVGLHESAATMRAFFQNIEDYCSQFGDDVFVMPQIGLHLTMAPHRAGGDCAVSSGASDAYVANFVDGLANVLKRPAYVRIGYEFNGPWNRYNASCYPAAFKRIVEAWRAANVTTAAAVWDYTADAPTADWAPWVVDPAYVDWYGLNIFSNFSAPTFPGKGSARVARFLSTFCNATGNTGANNACIVGESTPRFVGVLGGQASWDAWFAPYLTMVNEQRYSIRAFSYIDWNWPAHSSAEHNWYKWGEARIELDAVVRGNWRANLARGHGGHEYFHARPKNETLAALGCRET